MRKTGRWSFTRRRGVIGTGAGAENEGPVARLRQKQFPGGLLERPRLQPGDVFKLLRQFRHPSAPCAGADKSIRSFVQPGAPISLLRPSWRPRAWRFVASGARRYSVGVTRVKASDRSRLCARNNSKLRPFIPPVSEKFGIVRRKNQRRPVKNGSIMPLATHQLPRSRWDVHRRDHRLPDHPRHHRRKYILPPLNRAMQSSSGGDPYLPGSG